MNFELLDLSDSTQSSEYLDLWRSCFGDKGGPKSKTLNEWCTWYNLDCPSGKNKVYAIRDSNSKKIVSAYGLLPMVCVYKGIEYRAALCSNVMTHPDWGGRGLFTKMGKYAIADDKKSGTKFQVGIPNTNAIKGHMKVGWQRYPNIQFYEKTEFDVGNSLPVYKKINQFHPNMDAKIEGFHKKYQFYVKKNNRFLNWRYIDHPYNDYDVFILGEDISSFSGYVVVKLFKDDITKKVHVIDYAYETCNDLDNIFKIVNEYARISHADLINCWTFSLEENHEEKNIFENNRFILADYENMLIINSDVDFFGTRKILWHIVLGDNDVY